MSRAVKQGVFRDGNGAVVTTARAGIVSVFLAGTTTPANIYIASSGGTAVNSVNTDTSGRFKFYVDDGDYAVSQKFDIILSGTGINSQTYTDEVVFFPYPGDTYITEMVTYEVDALITYGGGVNFTKATIDAALAVIGPTNKATLLLRPGTWVIDADADWSAYTNVTFKIVPGVILQIATGTTMTIGGPLESGPYQIFNCVGTGKVVFGVGSIYEAKTSWFGTNAAAFQSAILSIEGTVKRLCVDQVLTFAGSGTTLVEITKPFTLISDPNLVHVISAGTTAANIITINPAVVAFYKHTFDGFHLQTEDMNYDGQLLSVNYDSTHNIGYMRILHSAFLNENNSATYYAINFLNNPADLNLSGAFLTEVSESKIAGGIVGLKMGDSNSFIHNKYYGSLHAMVVGHVPGAANFKFDQNNVTSREGGLILYEALNPSITNNQFVFERSLKGADPNTGGVFIGLTGTSTSMIENPVVKGNLINHNVYTDYGIIVDYCRKADIGNNFIQRGVAETGYSATKHIYVTPHAVNTIIGNNNNWLTNEGTHDVTAFIDDGGFGTSGLYKAVTSFSNSWIAEDLTNYPVQVHKDIDGYVTLTGALANGTATALTVMCTLPDGFRPRWSIQVAVSSLNSGGTHILGSVLIANGGEVQFLTGDNTGMLISARFKVAGSGL